MSRILLIYTGGTIGMGRNALTGALEPLDFNHLLDAMPEMRQVRAQVEVYQFNPAIDSSDMDHTQWERLATIIRDNYDTHDGFVILHGTDTMAYTASALSFMLQNLTKPVILTGSQLPMGVLRTDGKENVVTSIELAMACDASGRPRVPEVCIYFSGRLLRGNRATKINADGFVAFDSFNYPHLCDAGVDFSFRDHHILHPQWDKPVRVHTEINPNVIVFSLFPGIQPCVVHQILSAPGLRGVVMRTYGSGNAPQYEWMTRMLADAVARDIVVVNISQCLSGTVSMDRYDSGFNLKSLGVISGVDSTVEAAVTKLMHLCALYSDDPDAIRAHMQRPLAGEFSL